MSNWELCLCLILLILIGSAVASDVPFVFNKNTPSIAGLTSSQLEHAHLSSPDLAGVPPVTNVPGDVALNVPVVGGGSNPHGTISENVDYLINLLDSRVEPDNSKVRELAKNIAGGHPGDCTIDQIDDIFSYLVGGDNSGYTHKKGWSYIGPPRGINNFFYANQTIRQSESKDYVGAGDCGDFAILISALVESIGGTTRIVLASNNTTGGHAYAQVYIGRDDIQNSETEQIIKYLQNAFDTEFIFANVDTNTKDVWLNLDWWPDQNGDPHPGGSIFTGERNLVIYIRKNYPTNQVRSAKAANKLPKLFSLISDKPSPQTAGSNITWIAEAKDSEKDQILYQFFLNDDPKTKWIKDTKWVWSTNDFDVGTNTIEVRVRDGKHSLANSFDDHAFSIFNITVSIPISLSTAPGSVPSSDVNRTPVVNGLTPDLSSPQIVGTRISWNADAIDQDSDKIFYRFFLNSQPQTNWSTDNKWVWTTTNTNIGDNQIEVRIRDGKHADLNNFDSSKVASFKMTASRTIPQANSPQVETTPHSETISGTGSIKKDYYTLNKANDYAKVSVDIKNAAYYEYKYDTHSDEKQCIADLDLYVKQAESVTCSGNATNRKGIPTNMTTSVKNGNLTYNNSVVASDQTMQVYQNVIEASGDSIYAIGTVLGDSNMAIENRIAAIAYEKFQSMQKISFGGDTLTNARINAITGPLKATSYIAVGGRILNATANVVAGVAAINQSISLNNAYQDSKGVIGGANFDTSIETATENRTHIYSATGSGNLINLSQRASGTDAYYGMEYEYMPISYSTGIYDTEYARGGSEVRSKDFSANVLVADHCEHLQVAHKTDLSKDALTTTSVNAIAGPLKVTSYVLTGDRTLNATADIAAGVVSIDQLMNPTEAFQNSKGVLGGATFDTSVKDAGRKKKHAYTEVGSGNLINLSQLASWMDARYKVEYEYMPVSYQTGTYDMDLNSSKTDGI